MSAFKRHAGFTRKRARRPLGLAKSPCDLEFNIFSNQEL
jgi:hypothetical protein